MFYVVRKEFSTKLRRLIATSTVDPDYSELEEIWVSYGCHFTEEGADGLEVYDSSQLYQAFRVRGADLRIGQPIKYNDGVFACTTILSISRSRDKMLKDMYDYSGDIVSRVLRELR